MQRTYRERKHICGKYMEVEIFPVYTKARGRGKRKKPTTEIKQRLNQRHAEAKLRLFRDCFLFVCFFSKTCFPGRRALFGVTGRYQGWQEFSDYQLFGSLVLLLQNTTCALLPKLPGKSLYLSKHPNRYVGWGAHHAGCTFSLWFFLLKQGCCRSDLALMRKPHVPFLLLLFTAFDEEHQTNRYRNGYQNQRTVNEQLSVIRAIVGGLLRGCFAGDGFAGSSGINSAAAGACSVLVAVTCGDFLGNRSSAKCTGMLYGSNLIAGSFRDDLTCIPVVVTVLGAGKGDRVGFSVAVKKNLLDIVGILNAHSDLIIP